MADILNKLNSANYITVKVTDDPITNGNNLIAAYTLAKNTNPNGIIKSATNRLSIILPVAIYDLGTQSLTLDTQYIDIIGSTDDRNNHYIKSNVGVINRGTIIQTANDVKLYNLTIENTNTTYTIAFNNTNPAAYFLSDNLNLVYVENVRFLSNVSFVFSMRFGISLSGTFKDCTGGDYSFGSGFDSKTLSGTFKDCTGGDSSFGWGNNNTLSGTFTNCTGGNNSFGGSNNTLSGTFTNCTGGNNSFGGGNSTLSGTFKDCTGGNYSFGGGNNSTLSGTFKDCTGGNNSFGGNVLNFNSNLSGAFTNCTGGISSFGGFDFGSSLGTINGTFKDCKGGIRSFANL